MFVLYDLLLHHFGAEDSRLRFSTFRPAIRRRHTRSQTSNAERSAANSV